MSVTLQRNKTKIKHNTSYASKTAKQALNQEDKSQFIELIKVLEKK